MNIFETPNVYLTHSINISLNHFTPDQTSFKPQAIEFLHTPPRHSRTSTTRENTNESGSQLAYISDRAFPRKLYANCTINFITGDLTRSSSSLNINTVNSNSALQHDSECFHFCMTCFWIIKGFDVSFF